MYVIRPRDDGVHATLINYEQNNEREFYGIPRSTDIYNSFDISHMWRWEHMQARRELRRRCDPRPDINDTRLEWPIRRYTLAPYIWPNTESSRPPGTYLIYGLSPREDVQSCIYSARSSFHSWITDIHFLVKLFRGNSWSFFMHHLNKINNLFIAPYTRPSL